MVGRRAPVTRERVVDAALALTRERGIDGWSLRDLAAELRTWPNGIAHHVGTREQVCQGVVDAVVRQMTNPPAELGWREWFRTFLGQGREVLRRYPGVARRLCRDGPAVPAAMPIMERGVGLLVEAGFGSDALRAYSVLLDSAVLLVALADDRRAAGGELGAAADRLRDVVPDRAAAPAWDAVHGYLAEWRADADGAFDALFDYTVDTVLAGLRPPPAARPR
ncbi:MAG: TetR/AcrR family transcriptional regulator C-terminal domain-containing protein [Nocardioides sp.]|uniref:TetR/AcrR family transcriptional regulator n=1 Tax=Nocardioides sp. TaxID=35761 RepID=UPI0039E5E5C7